MTCGAPGVIAAVVAAMWAQGPADVGVAASGCLALGSLSYQPPNANTIVLTAGGLEVICAVMGPHAADEKLQRVACFALWRLALALSPPALAVMRKACPVVESLLAAQRNHPSTGPGTVTAIADLALGLLE